MKRWPLVATFVLFIALCASIAYWAMQLFKPPLRLVVAPPQAARTDIKPDAAAALFGGHPGKVAVASNYQLRGVIFSGDARDSVAILSADGKPAQAIRVGKEVLPGVTVKEVHRGYALLSEGGVTKRVELPESARDQANPATAAALPFQPASPRPPAAAQDSQSAPAANPPQVMQPGPPGMVTQPAPSAGPTATPSTPPASSVTSGPVAPPAMTQKVGPGMFSSGTSVAPAPGNPPGAQQ